MQSSKPRATIAILADMPLERILENTSYQGGHTLAWIAAIFHGLENQTEFDVHWITLSKHVSKVKTITCCNQIIHIIPQGSMGKNIVLAHIPASLKILRELKIIQPDLMHIWGFEQAYSIAGTFYNTKKILSYQGALTRYCQEASQHPLLRIQAFWERRTIKHYKTITCESPWAKTCVLALHPTAQTPIIEYGVEAPFFHTERKMSSHPSCFFAGTIYQLKGIQYLIDAFKYPALQHIELKIAGSGRLRQELESHSTPNIHWLGQISREEIRQELSTAWALVHPTLADTGPTIVKEARVIGIPVITTGNAGSKQHITQGKNGFIIPPRDEEAIRHAVLETTSSAEKNREMGLYNLDKNRADLSVDLTVSRFISLYKFMLSEDNNRSDTSL